MQIGEAVSFSFQALRQSPVRSFLTGIGMLIGTTSVILVVTISLTAENYVLEQIEGVGSNLIFASYDAGTEDSNTVANGDFLKLADVEAVRTQLGNGIVGATGVETIYDTLFLDGTEQRLLVIGSDEYYKPVRNLVVLAGRFLDTSDVQLRQKVCLLTDKLAKRLYGSQNAALGQTIEVHGLEFTVIGTFKEKVVSFGKSEVSAESVLMPITVIRYFIESEQMGPIYVTARSPREVETVTEQVRQILESRHRRGVTYNVQNLAGMLNAARSIARSISLELILVSAITLIISGIGIMNIMLVTVSERTREIGVRRAVGASRREIRLQFLTEAIVIALGGGIIGILVGTALPLSVQFFVDGLRIPVSGWSVIIAFSVSSAVGLVFGWMPANRASKLSPVDALRRE